MWICGIVTIGFVELGIWLFECSSLGAQITKSPTNQITNLYYLKPMCIRVVVVYNNRVVPSYDGPTFDAGPHGFAAGHTGFFLDAPDEFRADDAFMDKFIAGF
jgi:hypothetical protein